MNERVKRFYFSPTERAKMMATMNILMEASIDFGVTDDRGGSGCHVLSVSDEDELPPSVEGYQQAVSADSSYVLFV